MKIQLNGELLKAEVMDTPYKRSLGMMGRKELDGAMVFPFDEIGERSFWMKNCLIPLDIYFIEGNEVTKVYKNCEPCNTEHCKSYLGIADTVIEVASKN
jgi:uncharacterized membrane protein (UPF0127 family)